MSASKEVVLTEQKAKTENDNECKYDVMEENNFCVIDKPGKDSTTIVNVRSYDQLPQKPCNLTIDLDPCSVPKKRKKTTYTEDQVAYLEQMFLINNYPCRKKLEAVGWKLNLPEEKVRNWFQNRRARAKRQIKKLQERDQQLQKFYNAATCTKQGNNENNRLPISNVHTVIPSFYGNPSAYYSSTVSTQSNTNPLNSYVNSLSQETYSALFYHPRLSVPSHITKQAPSAQTFHSPYKKQINPRAYVKPFNVANDRFVYPCLPVKPGPVNDNMPQQSSPKPIAMETTPAQFHRDQSLSNHASRSMMPPTTAYQSIPAYQYGLYRPTQTFQTPVNQPYGFVGPDLYQNLMHYHAANGAPLNFLTPLPVVNQLYQRTQIQPCAPTLNVAPLNNVSNLNDNSQFLNWNHFLLSYQQQLLVQNAMNNQQTVVGNETKSTSENLNITVKKQEYVTTNRELKTSQVTPTIGKVGHFPVVGNVSITSSNHISSYVQPISTKVGSGSGRCSATTEESKHVSSFNVGKMANAATTVSGRDEQDGGAGKRYAPAIKKLMKELLLMKEQGMSASGVSVPTLSDPVKSPDEQKVETLNQPQNTTMNCYFRPLHPPMSTQPISLTDKNNNVLTGHVTCSEVTTEDQPSDYMRLLMKHAEQRRHEELMKSVGISTNYLTKEHCPVTISRNHQGSSLYNPAGSRRRLFQDLESAVQPKALDFSKNSRTQSQRESKENQSNVGYQPLELSNNDVTKQESSEPFWVKRNTGEEISSEISGKVTYHKVPPISTFTTSLCYKKEKKATSLYHCQQSLDYSQFCIPNPAKQSKNLYGISHETDTTHQANVYQAMPRESCCYQSQESEQDNSQCTDSEEEESVVDDDSIETFSASVSNKDNEETDSAYSPLFSTNQTGNDNLVNFREQKTIDVPMTSYQNDIIEPSVQSKDGERAYSYYDTCAYMSPYYQLSKFLTNSSYSCAVSSSSKTNTYTCITDPTCCMRSVPTNPLTENRSSDKYRLESSGEYGSHCVNISDEMKVPFTQKPTDKPVGAPLVSSGFSEHSVSWDYSMHAFQKAVSQNTTVSKLPSLFSRCSASLFVHSPTKSYSTCQFDFSPAKQDIFKKDSDQSLVSCTSEQQLYGLESTSLHTKSNGLHCKSVNSQDYNGDEHSGTMDWNHTDNNCSENSLLSVNSNNNRTTVNPQDDKECSDDLEYGKCRERGELKSECVEIKDGRIDHLLQRKDDSQKINYQTEFVNNVNITECIHDDSGDDSRSSSKDGGSFGVIDLETASEVDDETPRMRKGVKSEKRSTDISQHETSMDNKTRSEIVHQLQEDKNNNTGQIDHILIRDEENKASCADASCKIDCELISDKATGEKVCELIGDKATDEKDCELISDKATGEKDCELISDKATGEIDCELIGDKATGDIYCELIGDKTTGEKDCELIGDKTTGEKDCELIGDKATGEIDCELISDKATGEIDCELISDKATGEIDCELIGDKATGDIYCELISDNASGEIDCELISDKATGEIDCELIGEWCHQ